MDNFITQRNDEFSWRHGYEQVYQNQNRTYEGIITNVKEINRLGCVYDVRLLDWDFVVRGCKQIHHNSGYSGAGSYVPLEQGTPVVIACREGIMSDALIIGTLHNNGDYDKFYVEGKLQEPGELEDGALYNQASGYPSRLTQTRSPTSLIPTSNLMQPYSSPEFHSGEEEIADSQGYPGIVNIDSTYGYRIRYSLGSQTQYTDGNSINVSAGSKDSRTTNLTRQAKTHESFAENLEGTFTETGSEEIKANQLSPLVTKSGESSNFIASDSYRAEQHRLLAEQYMQAAQDNNTSATARYEEAKRLQDALGSELPLSEVPGGKVKATSYSPPKERQSHVSTNNYGNRETTDINGNKVSNEPLVVIHETVSSADSALNAFENPNTQASYHALIRRDGTIEYLVPPDKRAYGAGDSAFNGESTSLSRTLPSSVNNFAYHISLESPEDGRGNSDTHSGYTDVQYRSLAYLIGRTGVPDDRITFHSKIDRTGERSRDPRSFDEAAFRTEYLPAVSRERVINFGN